jgi:triosephosphate isomerase
VADVAELHAMLRARLKRRFGAEGRAMRLLYGGSVKGDNAAELLGTANVDGALVGGASLTVQAFWPIIRVVA